jgi:hypothetical protein
MNESKKLVPADVKATEQRAEGPQRLYRAPQVHDLGRLEHVQYGLSGKYWDNGDRRSYS